MGVAFGFEKWFLAGLGWLRVPVEDTSCECSKYIQEFHFGREECRAVGQGFKTVLDRLCEPYT